MGQTIHELRAVVTGNIASFERMMKAGIVATDSFRENFSRAAADVSNAAARITGSIATLAGGIATAVAKTGVSFNSLKENASIAFNTILKDGEKAEEFLQTLQKFAQETPFTFRGLIEQSQFLLATGFKLEELIHTLTVLGDTMSALGKGEDGLRMVALALSQMRNSAHLMSQDMMQLTNQGIPAWQMLADAMHMSVEEVRELTGKGGIGGEDAFQKIMGGLTGRFGGGMESAKGSFSQLLSNLKDTFDIKAGEITKPLFDSLKGVFGDLLVYLGSAEFSGVISKLSDQMKSAGAALSEFLGKNKEQMIRAITDAIGGFANGVQNLLGWLQTSGPVIGEMARQLWSVIQAIGQFVAAHPQVLVALAVWKGAEMLGVVSALRSLLALLGSTIPLVLKIGEAMLGLPAKIGPALTAITAFGTYLKVQLIPAIGQWIASMGAAAIGAIRNLVASLGTATGAANALKLAMGAGAAAAIAAGFFMVLRNGAAALNRELDKTLDLMGRILDSRLKGADEKSADELAVMKAQAAAEVMNREKEIVQARKDSTWIERAGSAIDGTETPEETATKARDRAKAYFDELSRLEEQARKNEARFGPMGEGGDLDMQERHGVDEDGGFMGPAGNQGGGTSPDEEMMDLVVTPIYDAGKAAGGAAEALVTLKKSALLTAEEFAAAQAELDAINAASGDFQDGKPGAPHAGDKSSSDVKNTIIDLTNMLGNTATVYQQVNDGLTDFTGKVQGAAKYLYQIANPDQFAQASATLGNFLNSSSGQAANIQNQIAQLQQILTLPNVPYDRKQQVMAQIADLQAQLEYVSAAPPPMFTGISGSQTIDPGLQSHNGGSNGPQSVHVNLPNVNRFSSADIRMVTDAIARELDRRGRSA